MTGTSAESTDQQPLSDVEVNAELLGDLMWRLDEVGIHEVVIDFGKHTATIKRADPASVMLVSASFPVAWQGPDRGHRLAVNTSDFCDALAGFGDEARLRFGDDLTVYDQHSAYPVGTIDPDSVTGTDVERPDVEYTTSVNADAVQVRAAIRAIAEADQQNDGTGTELKVTHDFVIASADHVDAWKVDADVDGDTPVSTLYSSDYLADIMSVVHPTGTFQVGLSEDGPIRITTRNTTAGTQWGLGMILAPRVDKTPDGGDE